ncbi:MAG: ABC transporter permease [Acidobacteria bacterium]|nr:ABC transporter permease [Acidobacteriota bacterium]
MLDDIRYALRGLRHTPLFTTVALLSLAIGIGANTAIFPLLDQLLLRPMPVRDPQALVLLNLPGPRSGNIWSNRPFSYPMYTRLRDGAKTLDGLAAQFSIQASLSTGEASEFVNAQLTSGNWFETMGVAMALGRPIGPDDDITIGGHPVAVLSHGFWKRRFAGDAGVIDRKVLLNGQPMTVIGVMADGFQGVDITEPVHVLIPLVMQKLLMPNTSFPMESPRLHFLNLYGRIRQGLTVADVKNDLDRAVVPILRDEAEIIKFTNTGIEKRFLAKQFEAEPAARGNLSAKEEIELAMWLLTAMVGGVLLIACANVANLLLARATGRRKEIAVRLALGASRVQLIRLVLAESVLLALGGGALGLLAASWAGDALLAFANTGGTRTIPISADPDGSILLFTALLSLGAGLLFGIAPALAASKPDVAPALKDESGTVSAGAAAAWIRKSLIVAQVATSLLLLAAAVLFLTTLDNLRRVHPGFQTENLITFQMNPVLNGYNRVRANEAIERLREELLALPRVTGVSMAAEPLLSDSQSQSTIKVEGYQPGPEEDMNPMTNDVGPEFFQTMGIPLLRGRDFTAADRDGAPLVAVVSETFAKMYFKDREAIGSKIGFSRNNTAPNITIVGVVKETRHLGLRDDKSMRQIYVPSAQAEYPSGRTFYIRTAAPMDAIAPNVRVIVRRIDPALPLDSFRTMQQQIEISLTLERVVSTLCAAFGFIATFMAAIGLYGVMAFHVSRRTREIGIRMALGAQKADVLQMVLREACVLTLIGVGIGVPAAVALGGFAKAVLYGIEPNNIGVYVGSAALLLTTAVAASLIPARRASRVDPIRALRYE